MLSPSLSMCPPNRHDHVYTMVHAIAFAEHVPPQPAQPQSDQEGQWRGGLWVRLLGYRGVDEPERRRAHPGPMESSMPRPVIIASLLCSSPVPGFSMKTAYACVTLQVVYIVQQEPFCSAKHAASCIVQPEVKKKKSYSASWIPRKGCK